MKKSFQVVMEEDDHAAIKRLAKFRGETIGETCAAGARLLWPEFVKEMEKFTESLREWSKK